MARVAPCSLAVFLAVASSALLAPAGADAATAGVSVVDSTAQVGHGAGQYAGESQGNELFGTSVGDHGVDPATLSTRRVPSYGIESRETVRALVVAGEDRNGASKRVAIIANDLYIPQDLVNRRVAGILQQFDLEVAFGQHPGMQPTLIDDSNLAICVSHSHTSPYYSSPSWGVWAFQDVFDIRFYERFAQDMAQAVIEASQDMVPVRMGAASTPFDDIHRHSYGPQIADDGTPSGFPQTDNDKTVVVARFDDISDPQNPTPLAHFVTYGGHPEMLNGNDLLSSEYVHRMYQFVDRTIDPADETDHMTLMCQQNVGTSEPARDGRAQPPEERAEYSAREYAQLTRAGRKLADAVLATSADIENNTPATPEIFSPFATDFTVDMADLRLSAPSNRLFPTVSNCRTQENFELNPGIPIVGLPDCGYFVPDSLSGEVRGALPFDPAVTYDILQDAGVPLPSGVSAPSYAALQETVHVHLQAIRFGDVGITVCPCEQFSDQSREIKSRLDLTPDNWHVGLDYTDTPGFCTQNGDATWTCKNPQNTNVDLAPVPDYNHSRMLAQINNDAAGWEDPTYDAVYAESEPVDPVQIKGNFSREELTPFGYKVVMPISMSNDYWGYIVTYREYQAKDHYRKALTGLGPHSADYFATRLTRMAAELNGGPPVVMPPEDIGPVAAESTHQQSRQAALGAAAAAFIPPYEATHPNDGGTPSIVQQPGDIQRFDASHIRWVGGANYFDIPRIEMQRLEDSVWQPFDEQRGAVQMLLNYPQLDEELLAYEAGTFEWIWEATFEAYDTEIEIPDIQGRVHRPASAPAGSSQIPNGTYRFVIDGVHHSQTPVPANTPYHLESDPFQVGPWRGITVSDLQVEGAGDVSFAVGPVNTFYGTEFGPIDYPDSYATPFAPRFIKNGVSYEEAQRDLKVYAGGHEEQFCFRCTFRPWVDTGEVATAELTVTRVGGAVEVVPATLQPDGRWLAPASLAAGDTARVEVAGIVDRFGEINGDPSELVGGGGLLPEPGGPASWLLGIGAVAWLRRRRALRHALAAAALVAASSAGAATLDMFPAATFQGGFGERVSGVSNNTSYFAQSFIAPNGTLDELRFVLDSQPQGLENTVDNVFHLLLTETVGGNETLDPELIRPSAVVFESADLSMGLSAAQTTFSVPLGGLALSPGATYAWVLDAYVTADGLPGKSAVGVACCNDPYADGHFFFLNLTDGSGPNRSDHFGLVWNDFPDHDLAFQLDFTPIPEPGTATLLVLGLAAVSYQRRRR